MMRCATTILSVLGPQKLRSAKNTRALGLSALLMGALPLLLGVQTGHPFVDAGLSLCSVLLSGVASVPLFVTWLSDLSKHEEADPKLVVPFALLVNAAITIPLVASGSFQSEAVRIAVRFALPLASFLLLSYPLSRRTAGSTEGLLAGPASNEPSEINAHEVGLNHGASKADAKGVGTSEAGANGAIANEVGAHETSTNVPVALLVGAFFFSFAFAFLMDCSAVTAASFNQTTLANALGPLIAAALFLVVENLLKRKNELSWGLKFIVTPFLAAGFLTLPVIGFTVPFLSSTIAWIGVDYFMLVLFTLLCEITRKANVHTETLIAQGLAIHTAGLALGTSLGGTVTNAFEPTAWLFSLVSMIFVTSMICVAFWVTDDRKVSTLWGLNKKPAQLVRAERIDRQCAIAVEIFGLTVREKEIAALLAHNRSVNDIAEDLSISVKTVRTHIHNIYYKMDAHSRSDLVRILKEIESSSGRIREL
ncbi:MAG: helix-turn-helix transcriptional regulator [Eggerthellaceae bacterium]|nr:helix-turn-helix transcriptional regulator [Eggerthellaceae bacterium]